MTTRPLQNLSKCLRIPKDTPIAAPTHTSSNLQVDAHPCPFTRKFQLYKPTLLRMLSCVHPSYEDAVAVFSPGLFYHLLIHPAAGAGPRRWPMLLVPCVLSPLPGEVLPQSLKCQGHLLDIIPGFLCFFSLIEMLGLVIFDF